MDYNWLQNTRPAANISQGYTPDFAFLQSMQMKANQQYEQGFSQIKSSYSQLFNTPLTDRKNIEVRQGYEKQAKDEMKDIAALDLSNPKNVQMADNILKPFYEDKFLIQDQVFTRKATDELNKGLNAQTSSDEVARSTFNQDSVELIQYQIDNLRNAGRDQASYDKLEFDKYTPQEDISGYLGKTIKTDKFGVTIENAENGYITSVTNGVSSIGNWNTIGNALTAGKFKAQFQIKAKLDKELSIRGLMDAYPGTNRDQATRLYAESGYNDVLLQYGRAKTDVDNTVVSKTKALEDMQAIVKGQGGIPTATQKAFMDEAEGELSHYVQQQRQFEDHIRDLTSDAGRSTFMIRPEMAVAEKLRLQAINQWATGMAANYSRTIKTDEAYWKNLQLQKDYYQIAVTDRNAREDRKITQQNADTNRLNAETNIGELTLKVKKFQLENPEGSPGLGYSYAGNATADLYHYNPVDAAENTVARLKTETIGSIYSPSGLGSIFLNVPNEVLPSEIQLGFMDAAQKDLTGQPMSREDIAMYHEGVEFLKKQTGLPITNSSELTSATMVFFADQLKSPTLKPEQRKAMQETFNGIQHKMDVVNQYNAQVDKQLKEYVKSNPTGQEKVIKNGKIITVEDIERDLQPVTLLGPTGPQTFTPHELAVAHYSGDLKRISGKRGEGIRIGDKVYYEPESFTQYGQYNQAHINNLNVLSQYGTGEDVKQIKQTVIGKTTLGSGDNTKMGSVFQKSTKLAQPELIEASQPGNVKDFYIMQVGSNIKPDPVTDPKQKENIRNLLNNPKLQDYIGATIKNLPMGSTGLPMYEINVPIFSKDDNVPNEVKALSGQKILIERSPTARGSYMKRAPYIEDQSEHPLANGKSIHSEPVADSLTKTKWVARPWPTKNPTEIVIEMELPTYDPITGKSGTTTVRKSIPTGSMTYYQIEQAARNTAESAGNAYYQAEQNHIKALNTK